MKEKKDSNEQKKERKSLSIVDYKFSANGRWNYRRESGQDVGCDCIIEFVDDDGIYRGKISRCQVKGRQDLKFICNKSLISFPLESATYNMALTANYLFILLIVDLSSEDIYFLKLNNLGDKTNNNKTINIHIPVENIFPKNEKGLVNIFNSRI
ncbi:MAG: DUF4365 domain-containing protein [Bacilli bacterium]|nr:DUF4365 domain-containing protein [Bacilli bacterium]